MIGLDQAVKIMAKSALSHLPGMPVIQKVFYLTYAENTGASFGILQGNSRLLGLVSAVASLVMLLFLFAQVKAFPRKRLYLFSLSMIIAGALGNMIDRLIRGYVIDMFDFRIIHFAVFNVADSFISVGAVVFCCYLLFDKQLFGSEKYGIEQKER
jgi:signal peptidase II